MSKFRAAALSAAAVFGLAAYAGAQVPAKPQTSQSGEVRSQKDGDHGHRRGGFRRGGMRRGGRFFMKDLNLTDAQKSQIKTIHQKYRPQFESLRKQSEPQFKAMREARQKGDTSAATRARFRTQMEQFRTRSQAIRQQEQNEVRGVLTAEQRTKWDAAQKKMQERQATMKKRFEERRARKQKNG